MRSTRPRLGHRDPHGEAASPAEIAQAPLRPAADVLLSRVSASIRASLAGVADHPDVAAGDRDVAGPEADASPIPDTAAVPA